MLSNLKRMKANKAALIAASILVLLLLLQRFVVHDVGLQLVRNLYEFETSEQLAYENMPHLQKIVTPEVMKSISINNEENTLNRYLKFKNKPTKVQIIRHETSGRNGVIVFKIDNEHIEKYREFMLIYRSSLFGTVTELKQYEIIKM